MKKDNIKNFIIIILIIIILVLSGLLFISFNKNNSLLFNENNNMNLVENGNNDLDGENSVVDYNVEDIKKDTKLNVIGCDKQTIASVENGNIVLSKIVRMTIKKVIYIMLVIRGFFLFSFEIIFVFGIYILVRMILFLVPIGYFYKNR